MKYLFLLFPFVLTSCSSQLAESVFGLSKEDQKLEYNSQVISSDFYFNYLNDLTLGNELNDWEQGKPSEIIVNWLYNEKKRLNDPTIDDKAYELGIDMCYKRIKERLNK